MPWDTIRSGGKFKVVNKQTGRVAGTHPSKADAERQRKALYANAPEASIKSRVRKAVKKWRRK